MLVLAPFAYPQDKLGEILGEVNQLNQAKKYQKSLAIVRKHLKQDRNNAVLLTAMADIYHAMKDFRKSDRYTLKALAINPKYDWPLVIAIKNAISVKKYSVAQKYLKRLARIDKGPNLNILKAQLYSSKSAYGRAHKELTIALKKDWNANILEARSWNYKLWGYPHQSTSDLDHALKINPRNDRLLTALANLYANRRDYAKSVAYLERALASCGKKACNGFASVYSEDLYYRSPVGAYYLLDSHFGVKAHAKWGGRMMNFEDILRSKKNAGIEDWETEYLPSLKYVNGQLLNAIGVYQSPGSNIMRLEVYDSRSHNQDAVFTDRHRTFIYADMDVNYEAGQLGDVIWTPYMRYVDFSVNQTYLRILPDYRTGEIDKIEAKQLGSKLEFSPDLGTNTTNLILQGGEGYNKTSRTTYNEYQAYISHQTRWHNTFFLLSHDYLEVRQKDSEAWDRRYDLGGKITQNFGDYDLYIGKNHIKHQDFPSQSEAFETIFKQVYVGGAARFDSFNYGLKRNHMRGVSNSSYDHNVNRFDISYLNKSKHTTKRLGKPTSYRVPIEVGLGFEQIEPIGVATESENTFDISLKLFW